MALYTLGGPLLLIDMRDQSIQGDCIAWHVRGRVIEVSVSCCLYTLC